MQVAIVGGSIAGCAAAVYFHRAGHEVAVYERSASRLTGRGVVVGMPGAVLDHMIADGLVPGSMPHTTTTTVEYVTRDPDTGAERRLGVADTGRFIQAAWSDVYEALRLGVPDAAFHPGRTVDRVRNDSAGMPLVEIGGTAVRADLVVLADGYRSLARASVSPGTRTEYQGLAIVRGLVPEAAAVRVPRHQQSTRVVYPGGHGITMKVPGSAGSTAHGMRQVMWGFYRRFPDELVTAEQQPVGPGQPARSDSPGPFSGPRRAAFIHQLDPLLPESFRALVEQTETFHVQPVYAALSERYHDKRICSIGDAGSVHAPFTANGILKAINNAASLCEAVAVPDGDLEASLSGWDEAQVASSATVERSTRLITEQLIDNVPDLTKPDLTEVRAWMDRLHPTTAWQTKV